MTLVEGLGFMLSATERPWEEFVQESDMIMLMFLKAQYDNNVKIRLVKENLEFQLGEAVGDVDLLAAAEVKSSW